MRANRLLLAALVVAASATSSGVAAATRTGAHGTVLRSPITPVCRVGVPCSAPAKFLLLRFTRNGITHTARTDARGIYGVVLTPGIYTISTSSTGMLGRGPEPRTIRIRAGIWLLANLTIDTGIR